MKIIGDVQIDQIPDLGKYTGKRLDVGGSAKIVAGMKATNVSALAEVVEVVAELVDVQDPVEYAIGSARSRIYWMGGPIVPIAHRLAWKVHLYEPASLKGFLSFFT